VENGASDAGGADAEEAGSEGAGGRQRLRGVELGWADRRVDLRRVDPAVTKQLSEPVTLFAAIEAEQHEALRAIAFYERRSLADVMREALSGFISQYPARRGLCGREAVAVVEYC